MKYRRWIVGGLIAGLIATCGLSIAIIALTIGQFDQSGLRFRAFSFDNVSAEATEEQRFTVSAPARLEVDNDGGNVTITAADTDEIVVTLRKTAWGANDQEAKDELAAVRVIVTQRGDTVTVRYERPSQVVIVGAVRSSTVDVDVTVPARTAATVRANFGKVSVSGLTGDADLYSDFGDITVLDLTGALIAGTNSGTVTAKRIQAGESPIELRSDFGRVVLEDATAKTIDLHSNSGRLELTNVTASGDVIAETDFGPVTLQGVSGRSYDLKTNSGEISVAGAAGPLTAHTDFGRITITEAVSVTLDLKSNSGSIEFSGSLGDGPHSVRTDFGSVTLALPADTAAAVDLSTDFGKITTQFPITVTGEVAEQDGNQFAGPINGGGETLTVHTNSGNIALEILNP